MARRLAFVSEFGGQRALVPLLSLLATGCLEVLDLDRYDFEQAGGDAGVNIDAGSSQDSGATPDGGVQDAAPQDANDSGRPIPCEDRRIVQLALGTNHSCALHACGTVSCWGAGMGGQIGLGFGTSSPVPQMSDIVTDAVEVFAGDTYTCARRVSGDVACWGVNNDGRLGDGSGSHSDVPVRARDVVGAQRLARGCKNHTCALDSSMTGVWCWGANDRGQLGDGTRLPHASPVQVSGLSGTVVDLAVGLHSCAVTATGDLYCWGDNSFGAIGDGTGEHQPTPVLVDGVPGAQRVAAGVGHTCVIQSGGGVRCWGFNRFGQLGTGGTENLLLARDAGLAQVSGAVQIVAGDGHTCLLDEAGNATCWGRNHRGQLGLGTMGDVSRPEPILTSRIAQIAAGNHHTCVLRMDQSVLCFGANESGQLGDGTTDDRNEPVRVLFGM